MTKQSEWWNGRHWSNACQGPGTTLRACQALTHDNDYYPHFTDEQMEAQGTQQVNDKVRMWTQTFWFKAYCIWNFGLEEREREEVEKWPPTPDSEASLMLGGGVRVTGEEHTPRCLNVCCLPHLVKCSSVDVTMLVLRKANKRQHYSQCGNFHFTAEFPLLWSFLLYDIYNMTGIVSGSFTRTPVRRRENSMNPKLFKPMWRKEE